MNFDNLNTENGFNLWENQSLNSFFNPFSYFFIRRKLDVIDNWFVDGQFSVVCLRSLGFNVTRTSFDMTSIAPFVFDYCVRAKKKVALVGAKENEINKAVAFLKDAFPGLNVVFFRNGYFSSDDELEETFLEIARLDPDFVVCGMGAGKQEEFLFRLRRNGWKGTGYTCGGFFHQTASSGLAYYPKWADKYHLRWLYRMIDEPKLVVRYMKYYPFFPFVLLFDFCMRNRRI